MPLAAIASIDVGGDKTTESATGLSDSTSYAWVSDLNAGLDTEVNIETTLVGGGASIVVIDGEVIESLPDFTSMNIEKGVGARNHGIKRRRRM